MDENSGWIKLSRKLLQTNYYLGEKFTKAMCWIDLLLLAEWRKERSFYLRGIEVVVKRGQIAMALADLHKRWNLSINTVQARLREMVKDGRISVKSSNVVTIITILNWEKYQGGDNSESSEAKTILSAPEAMPEIAPSSPEIVVAEEVETAPAIALVPVEESQVKTEILPISKPKKPDVDCEFILRLYHDRCPSLPKVLKLSDKRKMKIRVRFEEMEYNYETLQQVFDKAEASRFMRGDNQRGWRADFDWIFTNSTNWVKILEGKYDNKDTIISTPITNYGVRENPGNTPTNINGGGHQSASPIQRQSMSVLATLAKIEQAQGYGGDMPSSTGIEKQ